MCATQSAYSFAAWAFFFFFTPLYPSVGGDIAHGSIHLRELSAFSLSKSWFSSLSCRCNG